MPIVRQKLTVEKAQEPKSFGDRGGQKLEFTCSDGKKWITFKKSLFQYVIAGAEIDADTETKERPHENGVYIDRIIQEIYIDGKAVAGQTKQRYQDGDSPEKRASIEVQQAADFTTQLWIAGCLIGDSPEVIALRAWLLARLNPKEPQKPAEPGEITLAPSEKAPEKQAEPPPKKSTKPERDPMTIKNYTQLCKVCNEDFGLQPKDVLKELGVSAQSEITRTIPECYMQIAAVMEGPKEQE